MSLAYIFIVCLIYSSLGKLLLLFHSVVLVVDDDDNVVALVKQYMYVLPLIIFSIFFSTSCTDIGHGNPDAKRLYDDLISRYNKLVRPVMNVSEPLTVHIKLKLSQLIEVVSGNTISFSFFLSFSTLFSDSLLIPHPLPLTWKSFGNVDAFDHKSYFAIFLLASCNCQH